jgi:hypothetical protein
MPAAILIWVWFCAYLNCAGWTLSALHQLNTAGYLAALLIGSGAFMVWWKRTSGRIFPEISRRKLKRRFCRPFPLAFLILAAMAFLGGALYAPANYDALAYRTPRVLHWLAAGQWHWIHTDFARLNTRTAGFEWLTAPIFLLAGTDRPVFLLNIICFLLLPGRVFAVLTRLGVRSRAAWYWMWLFPSGYGYVLQAGSAVNDMFGSLMALAAFEFALRARREKTISNLWTSSLAAGLMTAVKAFNIVLLLPWLIAALPALKQLLRRPLASLAVAVLVVSTSMVPTSVLNLKHCGDWTGLAAEHETVGGSGKPERFLANAINLPLNNLVPPVFPFTKQWDHFVDRVVPAHWSSDLRAHMEPELATFLLPELQVEESAGLGMGVTLLLLALLVKKIRAGDIRPRNYLGLETLVPLLTWASLGVFMLQVGATGSARYLLPFYPLLAAPIMRGAAGGKIFQGRGWQGAALAVFGLTGLLLVLSPPRPLWPANPILRAWGAEHSDHHLLKRVWTVYSVYGRRADSFAPVLAVLPPDANPLGYIGWDEPEAALWRPFGSRRILHIGQGDAPADIRARGINYALVSERTLSEHYSMKLEDWLASRKAESIRSFQLRLRARMEPYGWALVKFQPAAIEPVGTTNQN